MLISISEAIRRSPVSRQTFYKQYINKGRVSVTEDEQGQKRIDVAELLRVFGSIAPDGADSQQDDQGRPDLTAAVDMAVLEVRLAATEAQLQKTEEQLRKSEAREAEAREELRRANETIRLIEHRAAQVPAKGEDPQLQAALVAQAVAEALRQHQAVPVQVQAPAPRRGLIARLFGRRATA